MYALHTHTHAHAHDSKVRLQVDGMVTGSVRKYSGMMDCMRQIYAEKGITGMWRGSGTVL